MKNRECKICLQETNIALLNQSMKNIEDKMEEFKTDNSTRFDKLEHTIENFIKSCGEIYVSKIEYSNTKEEIKAIKEIIKWFAITFIWWALFTMIKLFWDKITDLLLK